MRSFRRREGAVRWDLFRDLADSDRYLETFLVPSWAEHMRQHARDHVVRALPVRFRRERQQQAVPQHRRRQRRPKFRLGCRRRLRHRLVELRAELRAAWAELDRSVGLPAQALVTSNSNSP